MRPRSVDVAIDSSVPAMGDNGSRFGRTSPNIWVASGSTSGTAQRSGSTAEHQLEGMGDDAGPVAQGRMGIDAQERVAHNDRVDTGADETP